MNIRNIDLNLLYIFIVVYECGSITHAAEQLHLSQPAVSNAMSRLKNSINQTLFVNKNRKITPTRVADSLYEDIKTGLKKIEFALSQLGNFNPANCRQTFRIATNNYGDIALFSKLVPYLQRYAPNVNINRGYHRCDEFNRLLLEGGLDIALFFDCHAEHGVNKDFLFSDSMVLVTGPIHGELPDQLTIDDLAGLNMIGCKDGYDETEPFLKEIKTRNGSHSQEMTVENVWSVLNLVSTTNLAALVPRFFAVKAAEFMPLRLHRLDHAFGCLDMFLYWPKVEENNSAHRWLREVVKNIVQSRGG
ncbi:MAG: LysR family transcriptional regulator [Gammaproteobacteria bacterium]